MMNWHEDFPQLATSHTNGRYTYLDSGATTLKPTRVIDKIKEFYSYDVSNVHRGLHSSSNKATSLYEGARTKVARFLNAYSDEEIIFTRSTTESLNLAAHIIASLGLKSGDEVLLTEMEHHSNIIPWQLLKEKLGLIIKYIPFDDVGELDLNEAQNLITDKTKVLALCHVSNTLGTINDVEALAEMAKDKGAYVVVDAAQSVSILDLDVQALNCDFLAFSGHKLFAPFGIGILWGKKDLLNSSEPFQGGGSMIEQVEKENSTYLPSPQRYEAGTPNVAGAIALGEAIDYVQEIGLKNIYKHELELLEYATEELLKVSDKIKILGTSKTKVNVLSFIVEGVHHSDLSQLLDQQGVAVRAGHHCTQVIFKKLGLSGSIRVSLSLYNEKEDIDYFITCLRKSLEMLV